MVLCYNLFLIQIIFGQISYFSKIGLDVFFVMQMQDPPSSCLFVDFYKLQINRIVMGPLYTFLKHICLFVFFCISVMDWIVFKVCYSEKWNVSKIWGINQANNWFQLIVNCFHDFEFILYQEHFGQRFSHTFIQKWQKCGKCEKNWDQLNVQKNIDLHKCVERTKFEKTFIIL